MMQLLSLAFALTCLPVESSAGSLGFVDRQERRGERHSFSDRRPVTLQALTQQIDQIVNEDLKANPQMSIEELSAGIKPLLQNADLDYIVSLYVMHPSAYLPTTEIGMMALANASFEILDDRSRAEAEVSAKPAVISLRRMKAELDVLCDENRNTVRAEYFQKLNHKISDLEVFNKLPK